MRFDTWLAQAAPRLLDSDSPKRDAEILLAFVTGKARGFILAFGETQLSDTQAAHLAELLARREQGEPIAYLVGQREFWSLTLEVSPATLIPRPDTECLVEKALSLFSFPPERVLDLGTGTGAIALALGSEWPTSRIIGIDFSAEAVALAWRNGQRLALKNVHFEQGSWYQPVTEQCFELIVSNPPYIDQGDPHLRQGDVRFEPKEALIAADQGLANLRDIINDAPHHLCSSGWLILEHGWQQGDSVRALLQLRGFAQVTTGKDYGGNERITYGQWRTL